MGTSEPMRSYWQRAGFLIIGCFAEFFDEGGQNCSRSILISYRLLRVHEIIYSVLSWTKGIFYTSLFLRGLFILLDFFFQSNGTTEHQVESFIRKKLESLLRESQIRDKEDPDSFTVRALLKATHEGLNTHLKQVDNSPWTHPSTRKKRTLLFGF